MPVIILMVVISLCNRRLVDVHGKDTIKRMKGWEQRNARRRESGGKREMMRQDKGRL